MILEDGMLEINENEISGIEGGTSSSTYSGWAQATSLGGMLLAAPMPALMAVGAACLITSVALGWLAGEKAADENAEAQEKAKQQTTINQGQITASSMAPVC